MPLGGLKWENELEPREFRRVKKEIQVLGIDDAPFEKGDKRVKIVAALTRGARMLEGVFHSEIKKDGLDATDRIIRLVGDIGRPNARAILLDGLTYGGFNTVDIRRVWKETGIPVIACMKKRPDHARIAKALRNLSDPGLRKKMLQAAGKIREVKLEDGRKSYIQTAGIKRKDAEEIVRLTTINGLVPEPLRAAHMIARGAYAEPPKGGESDDWLHVRAYRYVRGKHRRAKRLKRRYLPGLAGEAASFLFALLIAWLFIQGLGWALGTATPLVVVESESMVHAEGWTGWHFGNNLNPGTYPFGGGMGIGDIILIKGDDPADIELGDVILYTKYGQGVIGGEPVIHRVVGIAEVSGSDVSAEGAVEYSGGELKTPCHESSAYTLEEIRAAYSNEAVERLFPGIGTEEFRLFITKGDNPGNNLHEDQCRLGPGGSPIISYPVHERLVAGRAKVDLPYLGYVKLGLVCAYNYATGSACGCRCWWTADNPNCCRT